jgi:hypothetical protein
MSRVIGTASNMNELSRLLKGRSSSIHSEKARLIRKHYPALGKHNSNATVAELAAEWYSDLAVVGVAHLEYQTSSPYQEASNKPEFLACLDILLTEAEKYSHQRGYGWRQHFAATDLNPTLEARLEVSGNETIRAVRDWHTEVSLPPIEGFLHRIRKIELWQNEQYQLTTLGLESDDWRDVYNPLFLDFRRAIYRAEPVLLRAAYMELNSLLPTLHTRWLPRMDEDTGEEITPSTHFYAGQLIDYWPYCEFVPLRPTSTTNSQRDPCLMTWLSCHLHIKQWYVWEAVKLLAGILSEPAPETPFAFQPPVPKPADISGTSWLPEIPQYSDAPPLPTTGTFTPLLLNYPLAELTALLIGLGLLDPTTGQATPAASPGAWVGVIHGLLDAEPARLRGSLAAIRRAFCQQLGAVVGERAVQNGIGKRGSEAERFRDSTLALLRERTGAE